MVRPRNRHNFVSHCIIVKSSAWRGSIFHTVTGVCRYLRTYDIGLALFHFKSSTMKTGKNNWERLTPIEKNKRNPFLYRREVQNFISNKFDGKYELDPAPRRSIFFKKNNQNRNIEYYHLRCTEHGSTFILPAQTFKSSKKFLKKCKGCIQNHNASIVTILSYDQHDQKLRNSHSKFIRDWHYILEIPGFSKKKPKSLKLKCLYHGITFYQEQGLLGQNHGCKKCASLASSYGYTEDELKEIVYNQLENIETGLSEIYTYRSFKKDKYNHYSIIFQCKGNGHKHPFPFKFHKHKIHCKMCPKCYPKNSVSLGEQIISEILTREQLSFNKNKTFHDLKFKNKLQVDFYVKSLNLIIEFDGQQHFGKFGFDKNPEVQKARLKRDLIKNEYCKQNNINLLRIPFTKLKAVNPLENTLLDAINFINKGGSIHISIDKEVLKMYTNYYEKMTANGH